MASRLFTDRVFCAPAVCPLDLTWSFFFLCVYLMGQQMHVKMKMDKTFVKTNRNVYSSLVSNRENFVSLKAGSLRWRTVRTR